MALITHTAWGLVALVLSACQQAPEPASTLLLGKHLPWQGYPFDLLASDFDGDGRKDLAVVDHGSNYLQILHQDDGRRFRPGPRIIAAGFHPGNLLRWSPDRPEYILSAEGSNAMRVMIPDADNGLVMKAEFHEDKPRYAARFHWSGWGEGLVISPYDSEAMVLYRNFDPVTEGNHERVVVPLAKEAPSVLRPMGPMTIADIDHDGSDEVLYTTPVVNAVFALKAPKSEQPIKPELLLKDKTWGLPTQVVAADLNEDGRVDLLVPDEAPPGRLNVMINTGDGRFHEEKAIDFPNSKGVTEVRTAMDKDGFRYVLAAGSGMLALYRLPKGWSPGQPLVTHVVEWHRDSFATALVFEDLDGDGWMDIVLGREASSKPLWVAFGPLTEQFDRLAGKIVALED